MTKSMKLVPVFLLLALAACTNPYAVQTAKDIPPDSSIIISSIYTKWWHHPPISKSLGIEGKWTYGTVYRYDLYRVDEQDQAVWPAIFTNMRRGQFAAVKAEPGNYVWNLVEYGGTFMVYPDHCTTQRSSVDIGKGEAVYIGNVVVLRDGQRLSFEYENDVAAARKYFEENFGDSGLTFVVRNPGFRNISRDSDLYECD